MTVMNAVMGFFLYVEEFFLLCLVLPWVPSYRLGEILSYTKRIHLPGNVAFTMYFTFLMVFIVVNIVALELHVLQVSEIVRNTFDEFRWNLFHALKLCVIIHRVLSLSINEAVLRFSHKTLESSLQTFLEEKGKQNSKVGINEDGKKEIESLREELQRTKNELNSTKSLLTKLQHDNKHSSDEMRT